MESIWCKLINGVPQGLVLAPVMFMVYVTDMMEGINSFVSIFTIDTKLLMEVENSRTCELLQMDLVKILEWSKKWEMEFNATKRRVMEFDMSSRRQR